jgi:hypothetical protein
MKPITVICKSQFYLLFSVDLCSLVPRLEISPQPIFTTVADRTYERVRDPKIEVNVSNNGGRDVQSGRHYLRYLPTSYS